MRADANRNPHCAPQWPHGFFGNHDLECLLESVHDARAVGGFLEAAERIRESSAEPMPFDANTRMGLTKALWSCRDDMTTRLESLCDHSAKGKA